MKQLELDDAAPLEPASVRWRPTSVEAAESVREAAPFLRDRVLAWIAERGEVGAACDEIEHAMGLRHQSASARVNELWKLGRIYETGRRQTRSGRSAIVWRACR